VVENVERRNRTYKIDGPVINIQDRRALRMNLHKGMHVEMSLAALIQGWRNN